MSQEIKKITNLQEYLESDPEKVWSGAMKSYHKLYKQYIKVCRDELHDSQLGQYNKETIVVKNTIFNRLKKLRKILATSHKRNIERLSEAEINRSAARFRKFLFKF